MYIYLYIQAITVHVAPTAADALAVVSTYVRPIYMYIHVFT